MQKIIPQQIYKHFKGGLYQILTMAEHTETGEVFVIYQALYGEFKVYARPYSQFVSKVDQKKYPEASQEYRFELQSVTSERTVKEKEVILDKNIQNAANTTKDSLDTVFTLEKEKFDDITAKEESLEEETLELDPLLLQFLDADSYEERLNILAGLHHRITDDMITTMSIACDLEVEEGELEERYESLKNCLLMMQRYECNRLR